MRRAQILFLRKQLEAEPSAYYPRAKLAQLKRHMIGRAQRDYLRSDFLPPDDLLMGEPNAAEAQALRWTLSSAQQAAMVIARGHMPITILPEVTHAEQESLTPKPPSEAEPRAAKETARVKREQVAERARERAAERAKLDQARLTFEQRAHICDNCNESVHMRVVQESALRGRLIAQCLWCGSYSSMDHADGVPAETAGGGA
jgi:RNase P subunit RPR2